MAQINENLHVDAQLSAKTISFPEKSVAAASVHHHFPIQYRQKDGTDVVSETSLIHTAYKDGTLIAVEVVVTTPPAGGDKNFTVDLRKGNQATGFATVLSAVITINSGVAARQVVAGVVATTAFLDGDTYQLIVTVAGTTGSQAQGVTVNVWVQQPTK